MSAYDEKDVAEETDVDVSEVRDAWHEARDHSGRDWEKDEKEDDDDLDLSWGRGFFGWL